MWSKSGGLQLRRYPRAGVIGGVCAGLAAWAGWNAKLVRVLAVLALIFGGFFPVVIVYLVLWYLMEPDRGDAAFHAASGSPAPAGPPPDLDLPGRYARIEHRLRRLETCVASREFELRRAFSKLG